MPSDFVPIKDANETTRNIDTFQRAEGADLVETQAVVVVDPTTGNPLRPQSDGSLAISVPGVATEATLAAGIGVVGTGAPALDAGATGILGWLRKLYGAITGTLNIGGAVSVSNFPATQPVSALNLPLPSGASTSAKQDAILSALATLLQAGGTVALDGPTLAALETITANTDGLTDAQLRNTPVPVSLAGSATSAKQDAIIAAMATLLQAGGQVALDSATLSALETINVGNLPADPATETTLAQLLARTPASLGQKPANEASPVALSAEDADALAQIAERLGVLQMARNADGSLRVTLLGGTVAAVTTVGTVTTVTTVTTVATLTNQTNIGGYSAAPKIPALMNMAAASNIDRMVG